MLESSTNVYTTCLTIIDSESERINLKTEDWYIEGHMGEMVYKHS